MPKASRMYVFFSCSRMDFRLKKEKQEMQLEHLGDIKANSLAEWIATDAVDAAIRRHFRHFLMTYVDDHGSSVYGERIRNLGESKLFLLFHSARKLTSS